MRRQLRISLFVLAAAVLASPAAAQERRPPNGPGELMLSYAPVVKRVVPAVVNVYANKVIENRNPFFDDPVFRHFFGGGGLPREQRQSSLGSGVIVDPRGLVVTNNHVIEDADEVKVALADKREFEAEIVLKDSRADLAVLRIKDSHERFPVVELGDSDRLQVGDIVLAVGNPFGVGQTVTHGIVSAVARTDVGKSDYQFFIQTDAAINPGNSGGALVDLNGRLIGINTSIYTRSGGSQGIGFAIPVNMVRVVVASAEGGGGSVQRPWFGAKLQPVTPKIADSLGLKRPAGAMVASVLPESPAARAGLKPGDVILRIGDQPVDDPNTFNYRFATEALGGQAKIDVLRGGRELPFAVALQTAPDFPHDEIVISARSPFQGAKVSNISPALAEKLRLDSWTQGVVIVDVIDGSPAQRLGLQPGDIIAAVNGAKIVKTRDLEHAAQQSSRIWRLTLVRDGREHSYVIGG
ncbi:MAG TPA: Do family serine endopeptidase [Xanthobacteraceae bacterium]|nr:Do family serine endopeptidase [Xanthobacteraceae bacterium]